MKHILITLSLFLSLAASSQVVLPYKVSTITAMKAYNGAANKITVEPGGSTAVTEYILCTSCTADESTIYAGAGGKKWKRSSPDIQPMYFPSYKITKSRGTNGNYTSYVDSTVTINGSVGNSYVLMTGGNKTIFLKTNFPGGNMATYPIAIYDGVSYQSYIATTGTGDTIALSKPLPSTLTGATAQMLHDQPGGYHLTSYGYRALGDGLYDWLKSYGKLKNTDKVVFLGDSWTQNQSQAWPERFKTRFVADGGSGTNIVNKGRSGMTSAWGATWFDSLVVNSEHPTHAIIEFYTNDIRGLTVPNASDYTLGGPYGGGTVVSGTTTIEQWRTNILLMVKKCQDNNIIPIVMLPSHLDQASYNDLALNTYIYRLPVSEKPIINNTDLPLIDFTTKITGKPTTIAGYGITDAPTLSTGQVNRIPLFYPNASTLTFSTIQEDGTGVTVNNKFSTVSGVNSFKFNNGSGNNIPNLIISTSAGKSMGLLVGSGNSVIQYDQTGNLIFIRDSKSNLDGGLSGGGTIVGEWSTTGALVVGPSAPATSAILDVQSTSKGFLPPRMTAAQAAAISSLVEGLMVYVTDTSVTFTAKGWWGYDGAAWQKLNN